MTNVSDKVPYTNPLNKGKQVQCHECEESGHIKAECLTFIKKQKNGLSITWYDSNDESESETTNKVMAFINQYEYGGDSNDKEMSEEDLIVDV